MQPGELKAILEAEYGFSISGISPAPRQFVAETFYVDAEGGARYFCKVVEKPLFVPTIIAGLPALAELHGLGQERIGYPIRKAGGGLYAQRGRQIVVLYNRIDAPQSYGYDFFTLGSLLGEIHALTPRITAKIPAESFRFDHRALFEDQFATALAGRDGGELNREFQRVMQAHEEQIRGDFALLNTLVDQIDPSEFDLVLTHGDAGGNVLVKSPTDIYIVDWDEILLAPKERDLWVLKHEPGFLEGYRSVLPGAEVNEQARRFCILNQYFYYLLHYFGEQFGERPEEHKWAMLEELAGFFDGWTKRYTESVK